MMNNELDRIRKMAFSDTADNFMKLSDDDKRLVFAAGVRESTRRKEAEQEAGELSERAKELEAYVERLRELLTMTIEHWDNDDDPAELHSFVSELNITLKEAPPQSLNHIRAEVEEETIERHRAIVQKLAELSSYDEVRDACGYIDEELVASRKYAKQAGSTVEEGE